MVLPMIYYKDKAVYNVRLYMLLLRLQAREHVPCLVRMFHSAWKPITVNLQQLKL